MAKHQIIYTSCMRGRDSVNDGQQVFSYDEAFAQIKSDDVKSLFAYQVPSLKPGVIMTENTALSMPAAFSYRLLKNGNSSITLNTYLGRDYMGSAGRFGNHLSHSVICDFNEMTIYPCEIYGSSTLRNSMDFSEVNNPEIPEYLPEAEISQGESIDADIISEFLDTGENLEYLKKMVYAMLKFQDEKKRIIICDETDRIVMWIAAIEYILPLDIAKKINFTTYEFDPELSPARICGVVSEGSRYNAEEYITSGRHYVFDFIDSKFSHIEAENSFLEFLDTAYSFSYESLVEFRNFVTESTSYRDAGDEYYAAYDLYNLISNGISETSEEQFNKIINFVNKYTTESFKINFARKFLEELSAVNMLETSYILKVLGFLLDSIDMMEYTQQDLVKQLVTDRIIIALSDKSVSKSDFVIFYKKIYDMTKSEIINIPAEFIKENNSDSLISVLAECREMWKILFITSLINNYARNAAVTIEELYPDREIGNLYFEIVKAAFFNERENGHKIIEKILDNFKDNGTFLVNITLNIEGFLEDLSLKEIDKRYLWKLFISLADNMDEQETKRINEELAKAERFDEIYHLKKTSQNECSEAKKTSYNFLNNLSAIFKKKKD